MATVLDLDVMMMRLMVVVMDDDYDADHHRLFIMMPVIFSAMAHVGTRCW